MREAFSEWYYPDDDAIAHIVTTGTIALDANALLDLYRVGAGRRQEILTALEKIGDRLFVPYQAAYEYQKNRTSALHDAQSTFDKVSEDIQKAAQEALTTALKPIRDQTVRDEIRGAFAESFDGFKSKYAEIRSSHILDLKEARTKDPVRDELDKILSGPRLGKMPSVKKIQERRQEAQRRIDENRPPGNADAKNKVDASGDYLIWAELLDHAKKVDRPILFVTNDSKKGDWFSTVHNKIMGPLPELVAEMAAAAPKHRYHQVMLDSLLWLTNKHLATNVSEGTIRTIGELKNTAYIRHAAELTARQSELVREVLIDAVSSDHSEELRLIREKLMANLMEGIKFGTGRDGGRDVEVITRSG
ncbi:PIN domain-containing protein [Mycobacteroides abscessus subsp. bolletii]|uniref:PIN domain-containing protein n=1 Tax=Mycobacteroides abscessus TaxID=36809 RepID=UPI00266B8A95|nr:PIN domain-containing protein [Mycobacteroides abscessus]MDO3126492.1 PIN domain-containing protein [Mycobacteroides abscessus subsp. bolletii]